MKIRAGIVAGTALALVMTAAPAISAAPQARAPATAPNVQPISSGTILLAQAAEEAPSEEELRRQQEEQQPEEAPAEEAPVEEAPAEQAPVEEAPAEEAPVEEPQPEPEQPAPVEESTPEQAPVPQEEPAQAPVDEAPADTAPVEEAPAEAPVQEQPEAEQPAPAEQPEAEQPTPEQAPVPQEEPAEEAPVDEAPAAEEEQTPEVAPVPEEQPAEDAAPAQPQEAPTPEDAPVPQEQPAEAPAEQPQPEAQQPQAQPDADEAPVPDAAPAQPAGAAPLENEQGTPILDSQKEGNGQPPAGDPAQAVPQDSGPPPASDREAQQLEAPVEIRSLRQEEGRRIERRDERRERREGADVVREIGDRVILQFNNQTIVRSDDRDRLGRDASEVYYEELPRGRSRETIVRGNGVEVVTIRDRYGDVIRRSRITPDGREYVLVYAGDRDRDGDGPREWRDPARDLPPLRLTIPVEEYILDAERVDDPEDYYEFLDQPPVEPVRRLYSVDEVKYSARVRDSVRRIDLDTITFEFGSASIAESEIGRLEGVAIAMERLLEENPAETFLIEGHTDAVGTDAANLALSDQRAESVAAALTNVFGIPPENLVTQGYGESYLKINTEDPERENRRVAMRRITALVSPVAEAQQ